MKKILILFTVSFILVSQIFCDDLVIDVDKAIALLHQNNLDLKEKSFELKIAERGKATTWNSLLPEIGIKATSDLMDNPGFTSGNGPDDARFGFELGISASLNVNYALLARRKSYILNYENGVISYEMAVKGLELETKIQFYHLLNMLEQIKIMEKGINLAEKRYIQVKKNFSKGLVAELDVLKSKVSYESLKPSYSNMKNEYEKILMGFKIMLGIDRRQNIVLSGSFDKDIYTFNTEELISAYMGKSLNLRLLNKNLELLNKQKKEAALFAYSPMLSFDYSISPMKYNPWADDYEPLAGDSWNFDEDRGIGMGVFSIALSMSMDNFIPGSAENVKNKNIKDQINKIEYNLKNTVKKSEVEIINIIKKLENSIQQLETNNINVELAGKVYEMTNEAFNNGTKELLDVEAAQNDLLSADAAVLGEQFNYLTGLLNLEYILNTPLNKILDNSSGS